MTADQTQKDKQISIDVPEDRVAEFYAFYARFLAGFPGRGRSGGRGPRGHRCAARHEHGAPEEQASAPGPEAETA